MVSTPATSAVAAAAAGMKAAASSSPNMFDRISGLRNRM
jgi:hypothetical protein